ncbi:MAG: GNAT family N-acetyltransferase [Eubacteriales bacterium]|nr:GNAT family N-acetyltransferase [Eubacteriales bacterium]
MERIESARQFGSLVKGFKKNNRPVQSNCFFVPGEVDDMAKRGALYWECSGEGLYFLVKEAECCRLYYYLKSGSMPVIGKQGQTVILDYVFKGNEEEALARAGCGVWQKRGFRPYKRYRRMECLRERFCPPPDQRQKQDAYPVEEMKPEDYPAVEALWKSSLDVYSTLLPEETEFAGYCQKGQVIGMRLADGTPGAVIMQIPKGHVCFLQHLVVSPAFRGLGMGRTLFCAANEAAFGQRGASKVNFWVDEANEHAISIYQKMGFVYDGTISSQFKLDEK